jgi:RimJ/RimL family protein N-acetyltransferase
MAHDTGRLPTPPSSSTDATRKSGPGKQGDGLLPVDAPLVLGLRDPPIILRPEREQDTAFLADLFRGTAGRDLARMPVDDAMKDALLRMQFASQRASYRAQYPMARFDIIEQGGQAIGRIVIDPGTEAGCIVDVALIPAQRNRGLGTAILTGVVEHFAQCERRVRCQVLAGNEPSLRMFRRVGFRPVDDAPPYLHLEWRPPRR